MFLNGQGTMHCSILINFTGILKIAYDFHYRGLGWLGWEMTLNTKTQKHRHTKQNLFLLQNCTYCQNYILWCFCWKICRVTFELEPGAVGNTTDFKEANKRLEWGLKKARKLLSLSLSLSHTHTHTHTHTHLLP